MAELAGLILAAGVSSRMGAFKPMLTVDGQTMVRRVADMMRRAGAGTKTWHITNPAAARETHLALDGVTIPIDASFVTKRGVKLKHPCDPDCADPAETVNCHCFLTYDNY